MAGCQGLLSLTLVVFNIDVPHELLTAGLQFTFAAALFVQWRTDNAWMFIVRAFCSCIRASVLVHAAICGREMFYASCDTDGRADVRRPFRIMCGLAALRMIFNAMSFSYQFLYPSRGVSAYCGGQQFFYRGCIRATGIQIFLARAVHKLSVLHDTEFERTRVEIAIDFIRAFVTIPIQSWSLFHQ